MRVRRADINDFKEISKISTQVHNIHVEISPNIFKKVDNSLEGRFEELLKNKWVFVIEEAKILGYAICDIKESSSIQVKSKRFLIDEFGIEEKSRRKGLGKLFFEGLTQIAKEKGCDCLLLTANYNNKNAIKFYKAIGFEEYSIKFRKEI